MSAKLISVEGKRVRIELTIDLSESMLDSEVKIQEELNEVGCIATKEALKQQDTDGSVLVILPSQCKNRQRAKGKKWID